MKTLIWSGVDVLIVNAREILNKYSISTERMKEKQNGLCVLSSRERVPLQPNLGNPLSNQGVPLFYY
jgi:hypothetical protein